MTRFTTGFSDAAQMASRYLVEQVNGMRRSQTFGLDSELREELGDVWSECQTDNWDGYKALPVSQDTLRQVYELLEELPDDFPAPSLSADPDGALALEWYTSKDRQISVSIIDGEIHYAAKLGSERHHGNYLLVDGWPKSLFSLIQKIAGR
jgi:hypothetical protein